MILTKQYKTVKEIVKEALISHEQTDKVTFNKDGTLLPLKKRKMIYGFSQNIWIIITKYAV
jgi:hypothetical protein